MANIAAHQCDLARTDCRMKHFIVCAHEQLILLKIPCGLSPSAPPERGNEPLELL
jgi:hypothetical protein